MKKIVPALLIIGTQLLIGTLFLVYTINSKKDVNLKIESIEMDNVSQFVYKKEPKQNKKANTKIIDSKLVKKVHAYDDKEIIKSYTGILTGYGPDCAGCGNFKTNKVSTASGYHIADIVDGKIQPAFKITYNDSEYGELRVVAADDTMPFNTVIRITIPNKEPILAIVLDRGSTVGFENCRSKRGCLTNFDLLFPLESEAIGKTRNVKFDILRLGK